jgi:predicted amidohydrolase
MSTPAQNLTSAADAIEKAAKQSAQIVVLPECLDIGWTNPNAVKLAQPIGGSVTQTLCLAAKQNKIYVAAGITEKADQKTYNSAILIDPAGVIILQHRKINILDIARPIYTPGESISVVKTPLATIGLNICADNFAQTHYIADAIAEQGAQIILSPCSWAVPADYDNAAEPYGQLWLDSYTTIAKKHKIATIGVSNTGLIEAGPWKDRLCIGCSLAVGHNAEVLAKAPYGVDAQTIITVDVTI